MTYAWTTSSATAEHEHGELDGLAQDAERDDQRRRAGRRMRGLGPDHDAAGEPERERGCADAAPGDALDEGRARCR